MHSGVLGGNADLEFQKNFLSILSLIISHFQRFVNSEQWGCVRQKCLPGTILTPDPHSQAFWDGAAKAVLFSRGIKILFSRSIGRNRLRKHSAQILALLQRRVPLSYFLISRADGLMFRQVPFLALLIDYSGRQKQGSLKVIHLVQYKWK